METRKDTCGNNAAEKRRVIIAGGGYAGTTCAVTLARQLRTDDGIEILLLALSPCQQALSELDLVAVGPARAQFCELWHPAILKDLAVVVCYNRLSEVRGRDHAVVTGQGEVIPYWRLVIATGAIPYVPPIPGLAEHAMTMWSVEDAQSLQQGIEESFKAAARLARHEERAKALSYTVVGGGATGTEIMGTLAAKLPKRLRSSGLSPQDLRLHLIEGRPRILETLPEKLQEKALARLGELKVEVITGSFLEKVEDGVAFLSSGRKVDSTLLVWTGGVRPDPHALDWGLEAAPSGRLSVDDNLKAKGRDDIYVIGDVANAKNPQTGQPLPMLAQLAIEEGPATAENILREAKGENPKPFAPHIRGEFVSIGPTWGVGWAFGKNVSGFPAILLKRFTYLKYWFQVGGIKLAWHRLRELISMWG